MGLVWSVYAGEEDGCFLVAWRRVKLSDKRKVYVSIQTKFIGTMYSLP
jgi:hypothetical protein